MPYTCLGEEPFSRSSLAYGERTVGGEGDELRGSGILGLLARLCDQSATPLKYPPVLFTGAGTRSSEGVDDFVFLRTRSPYTGGGGTDDEVFP